MKKFAVNQIVKGKVAGFFVVLGYRILNGRELVQVKCYDPKSGETSPGEMAFDEDALCEVNHNPRTGYNSFYGEVVSIRSNGEVVAGGFVIDNLWTAGPLKLKNVTEGF